MNWFLLLKGLHVLSAIVAVGANVTYGLWSARASREGAHLGFTLRGIRFVDQSMANPAYAVLLVTGLIMAFTTYSITRTWILIGLGLYLTMAVVGGGVYGSALKRQIAALDSEGATGSTYRSAEALARGSGIFVGVLAIAVVFVMVVKPQV